MAKKQSFGFTLVEIITVITIIALLVAYSTIEIPNQLMKVRDAVRKQNLDTTKKAIEEYYQDTNCYPKDIPTCTNKLANGDLVILDKIPCDPKSKLSYTYVAEISDCPKWYHLYSNLEYLSDKIIDKVGCRSGCGPNCQFNYGVSSANQKLDSLCNQPAPVASPMPSSAPSIQYVCSPSGSCIEFTNPEKSGCPDVYLDDSTCQNACGDKDKRCHDSSGKNK